MALAGGWSSEKRCLQIRSFPPYVFFPLGTAISFPGNLLVWPAHLDALDIWDHTYLKAINRWVSTQFFFPPKSWMLIGFSIINHPFWGVFPLFLETPRWRCCTPFVDCWWFRDSSSKWCWKTAYSVSRFAMGFVYSRLARFLNHRQVFNWDRISGTSPCVFLTSSVEQKDTV